MEGVLDSLVRELLTEVNDYDLCVTEFLRVVDMLLPEKSFYRLCPELHRQSRTPSGTLVRVQLLGQYPEWLAENAARAVALGSYGVDLNCGCPSKLVNGSGGGATLLKDPELIYRGAKAMREAVPSHLPVTVKVRLGWDSGDKQFEIADAVQQAGATELVVHGRTKEDGYKAERINWQAIGGAVVGWILAYVNYSASSSVQPVEVLTTIKILFCVVPVVLYAGMFIMLSFYKLTDARVEAISQQLIKHRAAQGEAVPDAATAASH